MFQSLWEYANFLHMTRYYSKEKFCLSSYILQWLRVSKLEPQELSFFWKFSLKLT